MEDDGRWMVDDMICDGCWMMAAAATADDDDDGDDDDDDDDDDHDDDGDPVASTWVAHPVFLWHFFILRHFMVFLADLPWAWGIGSFVDSESVSVSLGMLSGGARVGTLHHRICRASRVIVAQWS